MTERRGGQISKEQWQRHLDEKDSFDLYEAFKFRRPARSPRRLIGGKKRRCACGRALRGGHRFCEACIEERERQGKRLSYHRRKDAGTAPIEQEYIAQRRDCGAPRKPGHTYYQNAAKNAGSRPIESGKDGFTEKPLNVAVYPNAFVFQNRGF